MNKQMQRLTGALLTAALALAACQPMGGMQATEGGGMDMGGMEMGDGPNTGTVAATAGDIEIIDPWARSAAMEGGNSAIYMTLKNTSATADRLVAASGDIAKAIEVHETKMDNGVMQMHPVEGGLEVPANGSVQLKPGGYHVMLIGLTKILKPGDSVMISLTFESGATVDLTVPVLEPK